MLEISQMDLHGLARAYADGLLDFEQYRRARTQLLDRVTGEAAIMVQPPSRPMEHSDKPVLAEKGVTPRQLGGTVLALLLISLVVVLTLEFWLFVK